MKPNDKQQLHQLNIVELEKKLGEVQSEIALKQLEKKAHKLKDIKSVSKLRNQLAVLKTILTAKRRQQAATPEVKS